MCVFLFFHGVYDIQQERTPLFCCCFLVLFCFVSVFNEHDLYAGRPKLRVLSTLAVRSIGGRVYRSRCSRVNTMIFSVTRLVPGTKGKAEISPRKLMTSMQEIWGKYFIVVIHKLLLFQKFWEYFILFYFRLRSDTSSYKDVYCGHFIRHWCRTRDLPYSAWWLCQWAIDFRKYSNWVSDAW